MKKLHLILLCLMLSLSACTASVPGNAIQTGTEQSAVHELSTPEAQTALILSQRSVWEQEDFSEYTRWFYTITDLDHNGRLEVLAAITQGTGIFTTGVFCEVSEDHQSMTCYRPEEAEDWPEIIVDKTSCYYDPRSGAYHYAFFNTSRNGAAESWNSKVLLSAVQGKLDIKALGWKHSRFAGETGEHAEYENAEGTIPWEAYENAFERAGEGMQVSTVHFDWVNHDALDTAEKIFANYQVFAGARALSRPAE